MSFEKACAASTTGPNCCIRERKLGNPASKSLFCFLAPSSPVGHARGTPAQNSQTEHPTAERRNRLVLQFPELRNRAGAPCVANCARQRPFGLLGYGPQLRTCTPQVFLRLQARVVKASLSLCRRLHHRSHADQPEAWADVLTPHSGAFPEARACAAGTASFA